MFLLYNKTTVTLETRASVDKHGDATYNTATTISAYRTDKNTLLVDSNPAAKMEDASVIYYVANTVSVSKGDRIDGHDVIDVAQYEAPLVGFKYKAVIVKKN